MPTFLKLSRLGLTDVDEVALLAEVSATADHYQGFTRRLSREKNMSPKAARAYVERCIAAMFDAIGSDYQGMLGPVLARIVENRHQVEQIYVGILKALEADRKLRLNKLPPELSLARLEALLDQLDKDVATVNGQSPPVALAGTTPSVSPAQVVADADKAFAAELGKVVPETPQDFPKKAATPAPKEWTSEALVGGSSDPHFEKTGTRVPTGKTKKGKQLSKAQRKGKTEVFSPEDFRMGMDDFEVHADDAKLPMPRLATAARMKRVIGKKIADIPELVACWEPHAGTVRRKPPQTAVEHVDALWDSKGRRRPVDSVGKQGMLDAYEAARGYFWDEVRKHPAAKQFLEDGNIGGGLESGDTGAAFVRTKKRSAKRPKLSEKQSRLSLDHNRRKASPGNWRHALDPKELTIEFDNPNSLKESIQQAFEIEDHSAPKDIHEQLREGKPVWDR
jgi:hypothetical protein